MEPDRVLGTLESQEYAVHPGVDENSQTNGIADDRQSLSSADNLVCHCASHIPYPMQTPFHFHAFRGYRIIRSLSEKWLCKRALQVFVAQT